MRTETIDALVDALSSAPRRDDELAALRAERDAILAYAAWLQLEYTVGKDRRDFSPAGAVDYVLAHARLDAVAMADLGYVWEQVGTLEACRLAVREANR